MTRNLLIVGLLHSLRCAGNHQVPVLELLADFQGGRPYCHRCVPWKGQEALAAIGISLSPYYRLIPDPLAHEDRADVEMREPDGQSGTDVTFGLRSFQ